MTELEAEQAYGKIMAHVAGFSSSFRLSGPEVPNLIAWPEKKECYRRIAGLPRLGIIRIDLDYDTIQ